MKLKELSKIKGVWKYILISTVMGCVMLGLFFQLSISYQNANVVKANIANMENTVEEYNKLARKINSEAYRPVEAQNLDMIQTGILNNLAKNNLLLDKFSEKTSKSSKKKKSSFKEYDLSFTGSWENVINTVVNFTNQSDALMSIQEVEFSNTDETGKVKASMVYRIYTK